jgi:hypothetical protein
MSKTILTAFKNLCNLSNTAATNARRLPMLNASNEVVGSDSMANVAKAIMSAAPTVDQSYFNGAMAKAIFDNIFIAVTRVSDGYPLAVQPSKWATYNNSSYVVDGVLLVCGDKKLVISKTQTSLPWGNTSDSHAASGNSTTSDRDAAMADFNGKTSTNTACGVSEYSPATAAPGYCHAFSTVNGYSTGPSYTRRAAGAWYLPSLGELMMIWSQMYKINQVMSLIGGTALDEDWYWSSTETSQNTAWILVFSHGHVNLSNKKGSYRVRPVCAF